MPEPEYTGSTKSGRYYVHIPARSVAELNGYIKESGMYQAPFLSNALVVGARHLAPKRPLFAQQLGAVEYQSLIRKALGELAPEQREVLVMKIWGELTFAQIAAALAIKQDTAASRYRYAIAKLHEALREAATK